MKINKRNGILLAIACLIIFGLMLAALLPTEAWSRVLSFFTGFILPSISVVAGLIGINVGIDKFTRHRNDNPNGPPASGPHPGM